ncbi:carboxymuconolactone decarboxylase family protein [Flexivirga oryzae]|uniref:AhpD family alkylhydroperoxidase n=1 Tax=Flexivirga oryzae TaxID=1794944 RepID=A0A839N9A8_9MICO|nr:carboxymuconolactone decarboxylase family protein [Flexivirga oryzae]MBB2893807.1 AhpD family alkylhydroperoxidase [Flexivirga oryzae]
MGADLLAIVDIRASQINRCAWCLDMHTADARKAGVEQRKIDLIAAWHEAPALFTEREPAALALTEQVTLLHHEGVTDDVWARVSAVYDEKETVHLLMAIAVINVWNRMNVTARTDLPPEPATAG